MHSQAEPASGSGPLHRRVFGPAIRPEKRIEPSSQRHRRNSFEEQPRNTMRFHRPASNSRPNGSAERFVHDSKPLILIHPVYFPFEHSGNGADYGHADRRCLAPERL